MTSAKQADTEVSLRAAYVLSFVARVHELLAKAFARLEPPELKSLQETDITGRIIEEMRGVIEEPDSPSWAWRFSVHDDKPISGGRRYGKARPRIDIEIERTMRGRHPRFQFEAKRMYRSDCVASYVGSEGLGGYLEGTYAAGHETAGMLGYVQSGDTADWVTKIERKLTSDHRAYYVVRDGKAVWAAISFRAAELTSFRSVHSRGADTIAIIHTFLRCW